MGFRREIVCTALAFCLLACEGQVSPDARSPGAFDRAAVGSTWYTDIREAVFLIFEGDAASAEALDAYFADEARFSGKDYVPTDPPRFGFALRQMTSRGFQIPGTEPLIPIPHANNWAFFTFAEDLDAASGGDAPEVPLWVWLQQGQPATDRGIMQAEIDGSETRYVVNRRYGTQARVMLRFQIADCVQQPADPNQERLPLARFDFADGAPQRILEVRREVCVGWDGDAGIDNLVGEPQLQFAFGEQNQLLADTVGNGELARVYWMRGRHVFAYP